MPVEKRKQPRRHLIYYLKVVDSGSNETIGHLVDVSAIGMMVISKQPLETGQLIPLQVLLPSTFETATQLDVVGETVWCHKDVNPDYYAIGLRFVVPLPETELVIQDLVEAFGFQD
jgi:hypothetical protein